LKQPGDAGAGLFSAVLARPWRSLEVTLRCPAGQSDIASHIGSAGGWSAWLREFRPAARSIRSVIVAGKSWEILDEAGRIFRYWRAAGRFSAADWWAGGLWGAGL